MNKPEPSTNRRAFVRTIAVAAAAAPMAAVADDPKKPDPPAPKPEPSEVDARMTLILQRFGGQLDEAARASVRGEVESMVRRSEQLRKLALDNGDGPFTVFTPFRGAIS